MTGGEIVSFAYTFGDHCAETARIVGDVGYRAVGTISGRTAFPNDDPMRIPRIFVGDWDGNRLAREMRKYSMF